MKIVIAPQSFKGSLSALEAARAIEEGVRRVVPTAETALVPMADGGEGTVQALVDATGGRLMKTAVTGPLGESVDAHWGFLGDGTTAVIEMASASGLPLVPREKRNPLVTTTLGTGQLIRAALAEGARRFIIGIGGSATNDGGAGMAQALGARLLDENGHDLPFGGAALASLARIDVSGLDPRLSGAEVRVACDVNNPLCGPTGASAIYGPQKGATPEMVVQLDAALRHYARIIQRDLGADVLDRPGAGAAGGLGAGLMAFLHATLQPGVDIVIQAVKLAEHMRGGDLAFTGEGQVDTSTQYGKSPVGVAKVAKQFEVPVICLAGGIGAGHEVVHQHGIDAVLSIVPGPLTLDEASQRAFALIADAAERAMRLVAVGQGLAART